MVKLSHTCHQMPLSLARNMVCFCPYLVVERSKQRALSGSLFTADSNLRRSRRMLSIPSHWPSDVRYLEQCTYHSSVTSAIKKHLLVPMLSQVTETAGKVLIRKIQNPNHPANGQYGLFACRKIPPNTFILDYIGKANPSRSVASSSC